MSLTLNISLITCTSQAQIKDTMEGVRKLKDYINLVTDVCTTGLNITVYNYRREVDSFC